MRPVLLVRHPRLNRRGITGVIFALTTAVLIGVSAMAIDAALWYLGREQAYGVADAAALAGAIDYANNGGYTGAVATVASMNGFQSAGQGAIAGAASSSVSGPNNPPTIGVYAAAAGYTEVIINIDFPTYLASLFHATDINVGVRAVATVQQVGGACLLSLTGDLNFAMGVDGLYSYPCYFASNAPDAGAVTFSPNNPNLITKGITTTGGCTNCPSSINPLWGDPSTDSSPTSVYERPPAAYQPATIDLLAGLSSAITYPSETTLLCANVNLAPNLTTAINGTPCNNPSSPPAQVPLSGVTFLPTQSDLVTNACGIAPSSTPNPSSFNCAYYNVDITLSSAVTLQPGTYLMVNSSLTISPGASVQVAAGNTGGVTFVFAGGAGASQKDAGALNIDPTATVVISAASAAALPSAGSLLNGVLFYRDPTLLAQDSATSPSVVIGDNPASNSSFAGIMYFPGANVWYSGNAVTDPSQPKPNLCVVVIAGTLNIGYWPSSAGSSSNYVPVSATCGAYASSNPIPIVQAAQLVE